MLKLGDVFRLLRHPCKPMGSVSAGVLQPILDRIYLSSLGAPAAYREAAAASGLVEDRFEDLTPHLITHYARIPARDRD